MGVQAQQPPLTQQSGSIVDQMKSMTIKHQTQDIAMAHQGSARSINSGVQYNTSQFQVPKTRDRSPNPTPEARIAPIQGSTTNPFGDSFDDSPKKSNRRSEGKDGSQGVRTGRG